MISRKAYLWGGVVLALGLVLGWNLAGPMAVFGQNPVVPDTVKNLQPSLSPTLISDAKLKVFAQALALIEEQYAEPKTTKDLVYGAIQGAVSTASPRSCRTMASARPNATAATIRAPSTAASPSSVGQANRA